AHRHLFPITRMVAAHPVSPSLAQSPPPARCGPGRHHRGPDRDPARGGPVPRRGDGRRCDADVAHPGRAHARPGTARTGPWPRRDLGRRARRVGRHECPPRRPRLPPAPPGRRLSPRPYARRVDRAGRRRYRDDGPAIVPLRGLRPRQRRSDPRGPRRPLLAGLAGRARPDPVRLHRTRHRQWAAGRGNPAL
ncbi:MAG: Heterodimeric efflux ABC transporter, permease/ATP-binding subunit 1, partial [uncultured Thermomicrobiales bacterium]